MPIYCESEWRQFNLFISDYLSNVREEILCCKFVVKTRVNFLLNTVLVYDTINRIDILKS